MAFSKIRPRGDIKANWTAANPILAEREWGIEWETAIGVGEVKVKIGTGSTAWNDLEYAVVNNVTKKIVSALAVVSEENPTLNDGDSIDTLFGKIKKKFQYLSDKKLDKSSKYDGVDSTSTDLYATANAVRQVNVKADKNASDITTLNSNLSKKADVTSLSSYALKSDIGSYGLLYIKIIRLNKANSNNTISFTVPDGGGEKVTGYLMYGAISNWFTYISGENAIQGIPNASINNNVITINKLENYTHGAAIVSLR